MSGNSRCKVWVMYRRKLGTNHAEIVGRYTRETDAIADRDKFAPHFPLSVFTVREEQLTPKQRSKFDV